MQFFRNYIKLAMLGDLAFLCFSLGFLEIIFKNQLFQCTRIEFFTNQTKLAIMPILASDTLLREKLKHMNDCNEFNQRNKVKVVVGRNINFVL